MVGYNFLGCENVVVVVVEYEGKPLLHLLMEANKKTMFVNKAKTTSHLHVEGDF